MKQKIEWLHDPIVEYVHEIRRTRASDCNNDPRAMFEELQRVHQASKHEVVAFEPRRIKQKKDAA